MTKRRNRIMRWLQPYRSTIVATLLCLLSATASTSWSRETVNPGEKLTLERAIEFISSAASQGIVFIHCKIGYSRTAAVAGTYLLSSGFAATVEAAVAHLRAVQIEPAELVPAVHELHLRVLRQRPSSYKVPFLKVNYQNISPTVRTRLRIGP